MTVETHSSQETIALGFRIAAGVQSPAIILLRGELGVGKTTLAKGIIAAFGSAKADEVTSPTFSLVHEYKGNPTVYHLDLYRLNTIPELETLGLADLLDDESVVLIEWGEKFTQQLPGERIEIILEYGPEDTRIIHANMQLAEDQGQVDSLR